MNSNDMKTKEKLRNSDFFFLPCMAKYIEFRLDLKHIVENIKKLLITKEAYWTAQLFSLSPFGLNKRQEFHSKNRIHYT